MILLYWRKTGDIRCRSIKWHQFRAAAHVRFHQESDMRQRLVHKSYHGPANSPARLAWLWTVAAITAAAAGGRAAAETPHIFLEQEVDGGSLHYQDGIPIVILSGTPEDIGRQHAALLADPGRQLMEFPKK